MNCSVEIQNKIEELANILTSPREIAIILEVEPKEFYDELRDINSVIYKAFYSGCLKREIEINKRNISPLDVDSDSYTFDQLKNFKAKLIIQMHG
jgi:hypothetical protein